MLIGILQKIRNSIGSKREIEEFNKNQDLKNLHKLFSSHPDGKWIIGKREALKIWKLIKENNPSNIIELGLGIGASSAVMALASSKEARITSMEQFDKCIKIAEKIFPEELKKKVTFVFSEVAGFLNPKISKYIYFSGYKNLPVPPATPYDFVVIDGPGAFMDGDEFVKLPNGDLINLFPYLKTGAKIFVDGRKTSVELYERFLSNYVKVVEREQSYTILERTGKPAANVGALEIIDLALEARTSKGYW